MSAPMKRGERRRAVIAQKKKDGTYVPKAQYIAQKVGKKSQSSSAPQPRGARAGGRGQRRGGFGGPRANILGRRIAQLTGGPGVFPIGKDKRPAADTGVTVSTGNNIVTRKIFITKLALYTVAWGIVTKAIEKGAAYPEVNLWQAMQKIANLLMQAMLGEKIEIVSLPPFMWELVAAFGPKKVRSKTGYVAYSTVLVDSVAAGANKWDYDVFGPQVWSAVLGPITELVTVNLFNTIDMTPEVYDDSVGSAALAALWSKMPTVTLVTFQDYKPISGNDASAFADVFPSFGRGIGAAVGGVKSTASLEVFIQSPILAKFSVDTDVPNNNNPKRAAWEFHVTGGGPMYLNRMIEFEDIREIRNKGFTFIKHYDFFHLFDGVARWIGRLLEQGSRATTQTSQTSYTLTSLDLALLLRWVAMRAMANNMAIDIDQMNNDPLDNPLIPFAVGSVTTTRQTVEPQFGSFLRENIRSIKRNTYQAFSGLIDSVPVLAGSPDSYYLNQQYYYTDKDGNQQPIFATRPGEELINIIDCSAVINNVKQYVNVDGKQMGVLITAHNEWLTSMSSFSSKLGGIGTEGGTRLLGPNYMTVHCQYQSLPEPPLIQQTISEGKTAVASTTTAIQKKGVQRVKSAQRKRHLGAGLSTGLSQPVPVPSTWCEAFAAHGVVALTAMNTPFASTWKYQSLLWAPTYYRSVVQSDNDLQWYRQEMMEYYLNLTESQPSDDIAATTFGTVGERNLNRAELDVKSNNSGPTEWKLTVNF